MVRLSSLLGYGRKTVGPVSQHSHRFVLVGRKKTHITIRKTVGVVDPGGVASLYGLWDMGRDGTSHGT